MSKAASIAYAAITERNRLRTLRQSAVRLNASRRARGLASLPVPPDPGKVYIPVAYEADGTYAGILESPDDCPLNCHVVMETR
jgi:hypothetical protein